MPLWCSQLFIYRVGFTFECSTASLNPSWMAFHQKSKPLNDGFHLMGCVQCGQHESGRTCFTEIFFRLCKLVSFGHKLQLIISRSS
jgi:hypothetical protein